MPFYDAIVSLKSDISYGAALLDELSLGQFDKILNSVNVACISEVRLFSLFPLNICICSFSDHSLISTNISHRALSINYQPNGLKKIGNFSRTL